MLHTTWKFQGWEVLALKASGLLLGMIIGIYFANFWRPLLTIVMASFIILTAIAVHVWYHAVHGKN